MGFINHDAPQLFEKEFPDGSRFRCSEFFVHKYLSTLGWSEQTSTCPAQKLPENYKQILANLFLHQAYIICDHGIVPQLQVNTDQTQLHYQMGGKCARNKAGEKQITTMGMEEKHAFMLIPSISASGELLPFQAIFFSKTAESCPQHSTRNYNRAVLLGFKFKPSHSKTYWSTQATMVLLVTDIIALYFDHQNKELGLPNSQSVMWMIDCWSVHRSQEFSDYMREKHPTIIISFIPANLTGLAQPPNISI